MKKIFYSMLSVVLVLSILGMALPLTAAAELKPVVAVSFSGYSELKADVEAIGKLVGRPELAQMMEGMLAMVTQGKGLAMLDQNQPLGVVVLSDGSEDFTAIWFSAHQRFAAADGTDEERRAGRESKGRRRRV